LALLAWKATGPVCNGVLPLTALSHHMKPVGDMLRLRYKDAALNRVQKK